MRFCCHSNKILVKNVSFSRSYTISGIYALMVEKHALRKTAYLPNRTCVGASLIPYVVWRGVWKRDARFAAGLESSFSSFGETSLVVLTHRCQMGNGGEAAEGA